MSALGRSFSLCSDAGRPWRGQIRQRRAGAKL